MTHRILHIIPSLDRAGAEKQLVLVVQGLRERGFDAHVCALTRGGPHRRSLESAGIPVEVLGKRWRVDPVAMGRLVRHVTRLRPDLVHTWLFAANAYGRVAARLAGVGRIVAGERCVDRWKSWHQLAIDRRLVRWTDRIVTNSPGVRDFYVQHGLPAEKFTVIAGGVPVHERSAESRSALLAELGLPAAARLIGAIGRLWPQKRVKELIWAAELVHLIDPAVHLLVIGDGPQRRMLERFTSLLQADRHVRFLGERDDVGRILSHLDVCWLGSQYEGLPNAVMEAMAAGVPVVATDIAGNRDLVVPGETGFLVPVAARRERARVTDRILRDPQLARRLGEAARKRVRAHFGVERMIDEHVALYEELLAGR